VPLGFVNVGFDARTTTSCSGFFKVSVFIQTLLYSCRLCTTIQTPDTTLSSPLLVIPLVTALDTLVKDTHRLIGTSNLHLHKVSFVITTRRTNSRGFIHILPSCCSTQNIIDFFTVWSSCIGKIVSYIAREGTCRADEYRV